MTLDTVLFATMIVIGILAFLTACVYAVVMAGLWPLVLLAVVVLLVVATIDAVRP